MPRTAPTAAALIAPHKPYVPPMAHRVHITTPYLPSVATDVRATLDRIRAQLDAQAARRRKPRRAGAPAGQGDMFPATVVCIEAAQHRRVA